MTTRAAILARAFGRLAMGDYEFDITPDERAAARSCLDGMMAEWAIDGRDLGYTPSDDGNDSEAMTTPAWSDQAVSANLAIRMAADFGKTPGTALNRDAKRGYDLVTSNTLGIPRQQPAATVIHGGGQRFYRRYAY